MILCVFVCFVEGTSQMLKYNCCYDRWIIHVMFEATFSDLKLRKNSFVVTYDMYDCFT